MKMDVLNAYSHIIDTSDVDSISEAELLTVLVNLVQRYNDLAIMSACVEQNGAQTVKAINADIYKQYPLELLALMQHNIRIMSTIFTDAIQTSQTT